MIARPGKLFTASEALFSHVAGDVRADVLGKVREAVVLLVRGDSIW